MDAISTGTVQVFYSYAHEDETLLRKLDSHLSSLKREEKIASWYDRDIRAGSDWERAIDERINTADIILLLISSDFIASNYCYSVEAKRALERHYAGEARIIPIILRPVDWQRTPLGQFQALPHDGKPLASYSDKDKACLEIVQGIRQVVDETFKKHSFQHNHGPRVWTIPYDRNTFFTGRESILQKIYDVFTNGKNVALSGIGGVGKTQTALEYAYLHRNEYQTALWARADTRELLTTDLAAFASPLKIVGQRAEDQVYALTAVTQWLRNNTNWLLIIDNVEDMKILRDLLPTDAKGHILCTTQSQATGTFQRIDLKEMGLEEGATFLLQRSRLFPPDISTESIPPDEIVAARTVVQLMGGLPLALDQAGAYIDEVGYNSLDDYRETYQQEAAHLLGRRSDDSTGHPSSVTTTISLALEKIRQANEVATELLIFYAFLHPDAIPDDIIAQGGLLLGELLGTLTMNRIRRDETHSILRCYSLIRGNPTDKTFSMHRLIQIIVKDTISPEMQHSWAERVVRVINAAFPDVEFSTWQHCKRYIAQVQLCATYIEQ
ncbi:MAG TPA: toll/interleukin-1 receptor domain-containing protein, partial [Ktedonobacteraceae bacterium]